MRMTGRPANWHADGGYGGRPRAKKKAHSSPCASQRSSVSVAGFKPRRRRSVAEQLLAQFAAFLRFERQGSRGPGQHTRNADRLAGFFAPAVVARFDARERL